jgi:hypothetical protein
MKKIILSGLTICSFVTFIVSCQKSSSPSVTSVENLNNPVTFITLENATDSGTLSNVSFTKTGYTAIIQRNSLKDNSAIDSFKLLYKDVTGKFFPINSQTLNPTNNLLVDSLTIAAPTPVASKNSTVYKSLVTEYYNFAITDTLFITGKTYSVIATVYTSNGNSQTATFASLFKW